jgi:hypothetical protein
MNYKFEKRWWTIMIMPTFMMPIALVTIYFVIKAAQRNPDSVSGAFAIALILIPSLFVSAIGIFVALAQMLTTFDSSGITRNYLLWKKHIPWRSIEEAVLMQNNPYSSMIDVKIIGEKRKFQINPSYYRDANKLNEFLDEQLRRCKN